MLIIIYAWCDVFVDWCFVQAYGVELAKELINHGDCGAGCVFSAQYYRDAGRWYASPEIGDQIFFGPFGDEYHTGLVYAVDVSYVYTIEGNTSGASGLIANGGGVCKKFYSRNSKNITGYGRPSYEDTYKPSVLEWQKAAIADGYSFPLFGADGIWGEECASLATDALVMRRSYYTNINLTRIVQKLVGVTVDGLCGPNTVAGIRKYQEENGLSIDGIVGINTWRKILL